MNPFFLVNALPKKRGKDRYLFLNKRFKIARTQKAERRKQNAESRKQKAEGRRQFPHSVPTARRWEGVLLFLPAFRP
jgi:hypothetical protein